MLYRCATTVAQVKTIDKEQDLIKNVSERRQSCFDELVVVVALKTFDQKRDEAGNFIGQRKLGQEVDLADDGLQVGRRVDAVVEGGHQF